jgi:AraC family transcriptional activator of pobA
MGVSDINLFYEEFVEGRPSQGNNFMGHFDLLSWKDLQKDLSACERLQRKPFYKIALVSGNAIYESQSIQIPISGYSIIFSNPMARVAFTTIDPQFVGKYAVFNSEFLRGTSWLSLATIPIFQEREIYIKSLSEIQYNALMLLFDQIEMEHKSLYPYREQLIRNRVFDIIHYVQKLDQTLYENTAVAEESLEGRFLKSLENAFFTINKESMLVSKTPSYYAGLLNTTVDNLNKAIKTFTGKTTQAIIHERIVEEANVLLRHSNLSVKEIAWCLHFQESAHFQNFYKRQTGNTPIDYRLS